ncbi:DUF4250 domain-containing protein [Thalassotalea litorea]|uniref:DUF4250 domain-containing protein n=1 Tax=Thalassotalea litorea TaxID=2020715 RepID=A0A5R9IEM1_9GAMM|nr:DUF4250 domain-containing protein [Thalassotalea litorea]
MPTTFMKKSGMQKCTQENKSMPLHQNMDPYILLSTLNMKMRNDNVGLLHVCCQYDLNEKQVCNILNPLGWHYVEAIKQFKPA